MNRFSLLTAGCLLSFACAAAVADQQMYKWVDPQGQVHYSQTPPATTAVKPLTVQIQTPQHYDTGAAAQATAPIIPRDSEVAAQARADEHKAEQEARKKAIRDQQCESLKSQLGLYETSSRMFTVDASGQRQYISDVDHDKAIKDLQAQIAQQCAG